MRGGGWGKDCWCTPWDNSLAQGMVQDCWCTFVSAAMPQGTLEYYRRGVRTAQRVGKDCWSTLGRNSLLYCLLFYMEWDKD
jgi:hypothetical protein